MPVPFSQMALCLIHSTVAVVGQDTLSAAWSAATRSDPHHLLRIEGVVGQGELRVVAGLPLLHDCLEAARVAAVRVFEHNGLRRLSNCLLVPRPRQIVLLAVDLGCDALGCCGSATAQDFVSWLLYRLM